MILLVDNYDSFAYNLVQYCSDFDEVLPRRNDAVTLEEIRRLNPRRIVLSPGPGGPEDAGICPEIIRTFGGTIPILGVCLGHQVIGSVFGASVEKGAEPIHGKISRIFHSREGLFEGVPSPFRGVRYHSLVVRHLPENFPLRVTARGEDGEIMALESPELGVYGVQFHPESVGTEFGKRLLENFAGPRGLERSA
jgi:anthranilate synthase/aminodeoxychorismate synthase-like glutamine amidotransferase